MQFGHKPFLLILLAPSGGGKSTICDKVLQQESDFVYSISSTTREPRVGETCGVDYDFISEAEFMRRKEAGEFIESALVHGKWYGTSRKFIETTLASGKNIILDIDVQGAIKILENGIACVTVFLLPPCHAELQRRLKLRGTDSEEKIELRLANAVKEISLAGRFDYLVINDELNKAVSDVRLIIRAEKMKVTRYINLEENYYRSEDA
jgi:guanylate kinase